MQFPLVFCLALGVLVLGPVGATAQEQRGDLTKVGDWFYQQRKDPMTDENVVTALTYGKAEDGASRTSERLLIQCQGERGLVLVLTLPENPLPAKRSQAFWMRVDEQKPFSQTWQVSRNSPGEFLIANVKELIRITNPMFEGKRLRVRGDGGRSTYSFSLEGFPNAMANMDHCAKQ